MASSKLDTNASGSANDPQYKNRKSRISKENAFMVLAMWMELSPLAKATETEHKAGAVLVTEENRLYAMDCTRDGVHAMVRLLMKHSQKLKKSTIYTSRRPCSFCAKLLVQCGVRWLYYLPTEPENTDDEDLHRVENLLKVAPLAHSYFVPNVDEKVALETEQKTPETPETVERTGVLMDQFWKEDWMKQAKEKLHWSACDDKMLPQIEEDFERIMKWISQVTQMAITQSYDFVQYPTPKNGAANEVLNKGLHRHLLAMAQILSQRTDDPKTGVGAVIWKEDEKQIVATGWNGFPAKALYGEFPRASDKDEAAEKVKKQKKYPYVIHAEQNALLMKNTQDISGSTLIVTKVPCQECVPLLKLEKVKKCVIGITKQQALTEFDRKGEGEDLRYDVFPTEVRKNGTFTCFVIEGARCAAGQKSPAKKSHTFNDPPDASQSPAASKYRKKN